MAEELKIGDRVETVSPKDGAFCYALPYGVKKLTGTIVSKAGYTENNNIVFGVKVDQDCSSLHNLNGALATGSGWYLISCQIRLVDGLKERLERL